MPQHQSDPLHGKTLQMILEELLAEYGWEELGRKIAIKCFTTDPSIQSSLTFLRKTQWARTKVENLYLVTFLSMCRQNNRSRHPLIFLAQ